MENAGNGRGAAPKLCPSAQPGIDNCRVLGVIQHRRAEADAALSEGAGDGNAGRCWRWRRRCRPTGGVPVVGATCATHKCPHFDGADCQLATRIVHDAAAGRGGAAAVHHPQGLPMVLAGGRRRVSAVSGGYDRDLRPLARDAGGVRIADRDGTISCYDRLHLGIVRPRCVDDDLQVSPRQTQIYIRHAPSL